MSSWAPSWSSPWSSPWSSSWGEGLPPGIALPLKNSIRAALGGNVPTFTRGSTAMVRDWTGDYITAASGEARFQGARRISEGVWANTDTSGNPLHPARIVDGVLVYDDYATRADSTAYILGDRRIPADKGGTAGGDGFWYSVTTAGTTAAAEPAFDTTIGNTTVDGGVTWTNMGHYKLGGFLREEQRENLVLYSADLTNAAWLGPAVSANDGTTVDGLAVQKLTDNSGSALLQYQIVTIAADTSTYAISFIVKKDSDQTRFPVFAISGNNSMATTWSVSFNTQTGAAAVLSGTLGHSVEDIGEGWRVTLTRQNSTSTTLSLSIYPAAETVWNVWNTAAQGFIYVGQIQIEVGPAATSPIPTIATAVTRSADILSYAKTAGQYNTQGAIVATVNRQAASVADKDTRVVALGNTGMLLEANGDPRVYDGTTFTANGVTNIADGAFSRMGASWSASAMRAVSQGVAGSEKSFDGAMIATDGSIWLGATNTGTSPLNGLISNVRIYEQDPGVTRLAQLSELN